MKSMSYLAKHGVYVPHFEHLAPVLVQQDCRAVRFLVHAPKTKMDLQAELLQTECMRDDVRSGMWGTVETKSDDGLTKAVGGKSFVKFVEGGAGLRHWRPIDRLRRELRASRCGRPGCDSKWLVHSFNPKLGCMVGVCQRCRAETPS